MPRWYAILAIVGIALISAPCRGDWPTYQGNAAHDGYVPVTVGTSAPILAWGAKLSDAVTGIAIGDGTVLAATTPAIETSIPSFFALDQHSGATLWSVAYPTSHSSSTPAYANGLAYIQTDGHTGLGGNFLHAYDVRTGVSVFDASYDAQWETYASPTPFAGKVYAGGTFYGGMVSFDSQNGDVGWTAQLDVYDNWTPAVDANYCYVYTSKNISTAQGVLMVINRATGAVVASVAAPTSQWESHLAGQGVILGSRHDAYTQNNGQLLGWDVTVDSTHTPHIVWTLNESFVGQPSLSHDVLYAATTERRVLALSAIDGHTLWQWEDPNRLSSVYPFAGDTLVTDNVLFVTDSGGLPHGGGNVYAIDLATGSTLWSYPVTGALAYSDNTLFVAGQDGTVYALSLPEPSALTVVAVGVVLTFSRRTRVAGG